MKKFGIAALVLVTACGMLSAQSKDWPDESSILDQARKNYQNQNDRQDQKNDLKQSLDEVITDWVDENFAQPKEERIPFTPLVISFVPGLSVPFGDYKTIVALGIIGSGVKEFYGVQAASVFSLADKGGAGLQSSGVFNICGGTFLGVQAAGVFNIADGSLQGGQAAGVFNIAGNGSGPVQLAGIFNIAGNSFSGVQAAGVFNIAGRQMKGIQAAGVLNVADGLDGVQVSGVVNSAGKAKGLQIGLVNIADSMEGLQLGLINIALTGIHSTGMYYDDNNFSYVFSQNGTNNFYTLFYAGMKIEDWLVNNDSLTIGAGFGFRTKLWNMYIDTDVSAKSYATTYFDKVAAKLQATGMGWSSVYNALAKTAVPPVFPNVRVSLGLPILLGMELFGGVSADIAVDSLYVTPESVRGGTHYDATILGRNVDIYPKLFFGIKF
jgi:hypothetical protein